MFYVSNCGSCDIHDNCGSKDAGREKEINQWFVSVCECDSSYYSPLCVYLWCEYSCSRQDTIVVHSANRVVYIFMLLITYYAGSSDGFALILIRK